MEALAILEECEVDAIGGLTEHGKVRVLRIEETDGAVTEEVFGLAREIDSTR
jgi:hypothetical protein